MSFRSTSNRPSLRPRAAISTPSSICGEAVALRLSGARGFSKEKSRMNWARIRIWGTRGASTVLESRSVMVGLFGRRDDGSTPRLREAVRYHAGE